MKEDCKEFFQQTIAKTYYLCGDEYKGGSYKFDWRGGIDVENLYQAFKKRFLEEQNEKGNENQT